MKNTIHKLSVILFLFWAAALIRASPVNDQEVINWAKDVKGVQLSIMIATNVFQVGSSATVDSVTKNSSTNVVIVQTYAPMIDIVLKSSAGKIYNVNTPMIITGMRQFLRLNPGDESAESIPVIFGNTGSGETVEPGRYTLMATRHFSSGKEDYIHESKGAFELKSNLIKVQITRFATTSDSIKDYHLVQFQVTDDVPVHGPVDSATAYVLKYPDHSSKIFRTFDSKSMEDTIGTLPRGTVLYYDGNALTAVPPNAAMDALMKICKTKDISFLITPTN